MALIPRTACARLGRAPRHQRTSLIPADTWHSSLRGDLSQSPWGNGRGTWLGGLTGGWRGTVPQAPCVRPPERDRRTTGRVDVKERQAMRTFLRHPRQCGLASLLVAVTIVSAACGTNTAMAPVSKAGKATWLARHQAMNARAQQGHVGLIYVAEVCRLAAS